MRDTSPTHINPLEQVAAIKANDERMLKTLYQENYYKIERYVVENNGSADHAKDIYQEAFLAVWRNIHLNKFHPESETALAGYLFQVGKNKWLDYLRSAHYKKVVPIDDVNTSYEEADDVPEDVNDYLAAVKDNFKHLGDNCKEVLAKFYYQKQSLREIARQFGWTEATARNNKYRCIQRLKELLKANRKEIEQRD